MKNLCQGEAAFTKLGVLHRNYFPALERHIPCTETVAWEEVSSKMSCNWNSGCKHNPERSSTVHHLKFICTVSLGKKSVFDFRMKPEKNTASCPIFQVGSPKNSSTWILLRDMDSDRTSATSSCFQKRLVLAGFFSMPPLLPSPWRLLQPWQCFTRVYKEVKTLQAKKKKV